MLGHRVCLFFALISVDSQVVPYLAGPLCGPSCCHFYLLSFHIQLQDSSTMCRAMLYIRFA